MNENIIEAIKNISNSKRLKDEVSPNVISHHDITNTETKRTLLAFNLLYVEIEKKTFDTEDDTKVC